MLRPNDDIFDGYGIEIRLHKPDDFLKVKETLTRVGEADEESRILTQQCHILHKRGRYRIMHFRELFALDGKEVDISDKDRMVRNACAYLLNKWELATILDEDLLEEEGHRRWVRVIPYKEKHLWQLVSKYSIGRNRASPTFERWIET